ncbi:hypothetical protein A1Q1_00401 [Trichosporon asahii var. asahii CBS 2479]|uniref:Uncharacterized protein n=1 Tax=Trichosporon asahii var. asahii (strain ATCC 90039 / CBS 2479 / JCM 2466 / KCTC 7840 / NBRC 103889/ NCYC 2677 / UAMH 7654) TaxID=1186058 RepID=J5TD30_TRIAS|nr:hypothetical protein A1Q1_00401 [Trichosporon asahii var. asahii CBS 2479]EJT50346.1 hypothetical protein A1Q1_00401 [Trichosporon asahii var. asahii CBS 2479]
MQDAPALASNASVERPEAFHFQTTDRCRAGPGESSSARSVYTLRTCVSSRNPDPELTRTLGSDALPKVAGTVDGSMTGALDRSSIRGASAPRAADVSSTLLRSCRVTPYPRPAVDATAQRPAGESCKPVLASVVALCPLCLARLSWRDIFDPRLRGGVIGLGVITAWPQWRRDGQDNVRVVWGSSVNAPRPSTEASATSTSPTLRPCALAPLALAPLALPSPTALALHVCQRSFMPVNASASLRAALPNELDSICYLSPILKFSVDARPCALLSGHCLAAPAAPIWAAAQVRALAPEVFLGRRPASSPVSGAAQDEEGTAAGSESAPLGDNDLEEQVDTASIPVTGVGVTAPADGSGASEAEVPPAARSLFPTTREEWDRRAREWRRSNVPPLPPPGEPMSPEWITQFRNNLHPMWWPRLPDAKPPGQEAVGAPGAAALGSVASSSSSPSESAGLSVPVAPAPSSSLLSSSGPASSSSTSPSSPECSSLINSSSVSASGPSSSLPSSSGPASSSSTSPSSPECSSLINSSSVSASGPSSSLPSSSGPASSSSTSPSSPECSSSINSSSVSASGPSSSLPSSSVPAPSASASTSGATTRGTGRGRRGRGSKSLPSTQMRVYRDLVKGSKVVSIRSDRSSWTLTDHGPTVGYLSHRFQRTRKRVELPFPPEELERLRARGGKKITLGLRLVVTPGTSLKPTSVFLSVYEEGAPSFFFGLEDLPVNLHNAFVGFSDWVTVANEIEMEDP